MIIKHITKAYEILFVCDMFLLQCSKKIVNGIANDANDLTHRF